LSQAVVFLQKGNAYQFDPALAPYPIGALVRSNDNLTTYQSIVPNNSNNPNSNMTGWRVYNGSGFIVDNLTTNDSAKALSAKQGKVLADSKLDANKVSAANGVASLDANSLVPVAQLPAASTTAIGAVQLNNTLTSVSTAQAATAAQAKVLGDRDFGIGQTWQDVTSLRALGVTYTNTTPKAIVVTVVNEFASNPDILEVFVNDVKLMGVDKGFGADWLADTSFIVPPGNTYRVEKTVYPNIQSWAELR